MTRRRGTGPATNALELEASAGGVGRAPEEIGAVLEERDRLRLELAQARAALAQAEEERRRLHDRYVNVERQHSNLASLCVASSRLHATLDRAGLAEAILEIVTNLVGSEELGLFQMDPEGGGLSLIAWNGIDPDDYRRVPLEAGAIGRAARTGESFIAVRGEDRHEECGLQACIPLKLEDRVTGALVVFSLLPHKQEIDDFDRELLDMLSAQAAMALYCADLKGGVGAEPPGRT